MTAEVRSKRRFQREGFTSHLGVLAATLGSAVGLGNIWKFPHFTGENGGAAFIFLYFGCLLLVGLPVLITELVIGRTTNANPVGAFKSLAPDKPWFLTGIAGCISAFLIMAFYTNVAGWVYAYIFKASLGQLNTVNPEVTTAVFEKLAGGVWEPLFWQAVVIIIIGLIVTAGVKKGIERVTKTLMPILFLLLFISAIRALTLPNAIEGVTFLLKPDFSKVTPGVLLSAMGLSFFKLSIGIGTMITYGSYMREQENLVATAAKVAFSDLFVSILAGMAIFPAVFAYGFKPDAGPSLLFITIPTVFSSMPLGGLFMVLFFLLSGIAATTALISMLEVPVAYLVEERNWSRRKATFLTLIALMAVGSTATLSGSVLADFKVFGKTMFDLFDYTTSNILMPLGGIATAIFAAWKWGRQNTLCELTNGGMLKPSSYTKFYLFNLKYLTPVAIVIILLSGLGLLKL